MPLGHHERVTPDAVALDYWLKPLPPESMPEIAAQLLAEDSDSPALREVAGMASWDVVAVRERFVQALRELGVYVESRRDAECSVARLLCKDATAGRLSLPRLAEAICELWELDEVIYGELPAPEDDLATMCWGMAAMSTRATAVPSV